VLIWVNRAVVTAHNTIQKNSNLGGRMIEPANAARVYFCPMHSDVRQTTAGKCPKCGMDLLAEGTRFGLLRHMISSPLHLMVMAVLMAAVMAAIMMMMR
jgi:Heavy metal binding domain